MKLLALLVVAAVSVVGQGKSAAPGCGGPSQDGPCAGTHVGAWVGTTQTDQVELAADCTYKYTGVQGCQSLGSYAAPLGAHGSVLVTITSSTVVGSNRCLPAGEYSCEYVTSTSTLTLDCGPGALSYAR